MPSAEKYSHTTEDSLSEKEVEKVPGNDYNKVK